MAPSTFVLLSGALTYGVPLLLAVRELWTLGSTPRGGDGPPPPPPPVLSPLPKPLPDCLIPRPVIRREASPVRVLEDA